ncbi:family 78 glycoside hydrolase catalytic domain [Pontiellaceae bacterium B12227]|nr:family 78 glycoside hydrolase catalytic domain [Pontiellaceae bacterium B12227]
MRLRVLAGVIGLVMGSQAAPVKLFQEKPEQITEVEPGIYLVDFGRVAFGNAELFPTIGKAGGEVTVHFGEDLVDGRVNRKPPGTVRYSKATVNLDGDTFLFIAAPPADKRNTMVKRNAVLTPKEWGVITPFRWLEVEGWPGRLKPDHITRRSAFLEVWDDGAASFQCSEEMLNQIWELCRYSIKATTFAGVYVDGDRERIPYEADAYINQLCHYYTDHDVQIARDTFDYLMKHPTWPTEWGSHMVFMAYADWRHTGDKDWLADRYESLKSKLLLDRVAEDGLVRSSPRQIKKGDLVDWPKTERDGFVFTETNTVVNAFYIRSLVLMDTLAKAVGNRDDSRHWRSILVASIPAFKEQLFNIDSGFYVDGKGTDHSSAHANLFPLAFGLVPTENRKLMAEWLSERGMACSVYAAQYLMEALFENGQAEAAVQLMLADGDRSWRHMVESGATITWEAWDLKYKPNQDWNHAWGAAPANLLPRYVLGVEAFEPGWKTARVKPYPSGLKFAKGKVPTPRGAIEVDWMHEDEFTISIKAPEGMKLRLELPMVGKTAGVFSNGRKIKAEQVGARWVFETTASGTTTFTVR